MKKLLTVLLTVMIAFTTFTINVLAEDEPGVYVKVGDADPVALSSFEFEEEYIYKLNGAEIADKNELQAYASNLVRDYTADTDEIVLVCEKEEGHEHTIADCYELDCTTEEHEHTDYSGSCYEQCTGEKKHGVWSWKDSKGNPILEKFLVNVNKTRGTASHLICKKEEHEHTIDNNCYTLTCEKDENHNHSLDNGCYRVVINVAKEQKTVLTIQLEKDSYEYDGQLKFPAVKFFDADGNEVYLAFDEFGPQGKHAYFAIYEFTDTAKDAGTHTVTVTLHNGKGEEASRYVLASNTATYEITKALDTSKPAPTVKVYDMDYQDDNAKLEVTDGKRYPNGEYIKYEYKLKDSDNDWSVLKSEKNIGEWSNPHTDANLAAGTYLVRAKADKNHYTAETEVVVKINDPGVENASHEYKSKDTAQVYCLYDLEGLTKVEVDGVQVEPGEDKDYTTTSGSTYVIFNPDYLNTLSVGKHDVKLYYGQKTVVDAEINIYKKAPAPKKDTFVAPKTGVR